MNHRILCITVTLSLIACVAAFSALYGGPETEQIDPGLYEYTTAKELDFYIRMEERMRLYGSNERDQQFKQFLGKKVNFYDELAVFWDMQEDKSTAAQVQQMESEGHMGDYDNQRFLRRKYQGERYYTFETRYHTCVVPASLRWSVARVRKTNMIKNEPRLLMIWGTVKKLPLYGEVSETYRAFDFGVESEKIFIVCDKIERPRQEYFEEWQRERDRRRNR